MDATFKAATKAVVVDNDGKHHKVAKGGIINVLNEDSEIVSWVSQQLFAHQHRNSYLL